jgi:hypothetical protein
VHGIAGERCGAFGHERLQELDDAALDLLHGKRRGAHLVDQARLAVGRLVPRVHGVEHLVGLVHDVHRRLGDGVELGVGHHQGDLEDAVAFGNESRHLHVYPDQRRLVDCHSAPVYQP